MANITEICRKYGVSERVVHEIIKLQAISNETKRVRKIEELLELE